MAKGPLGGKNKSPQGRKTACRQFEKMHDNRRRKVIKAIAITIAAATALALGFLAVPAMAQNPDVPNSALALDLRIGSTGTNLDDRLSETRFLLAVIMPITERFTVTVKMENRRLDLKEYQTDGIWKFETDSTFWEIGCRFYIGEKD